MEQGEAISRRKIIVAGAGLVLGAPGVLSGTAALAAEKKELVTPGEDLMREHGVLKRVLLIYRDYLRRLDSGGSLPMKPLSSAAGIIRTFVEEYHEKLEENHIFPRFRKAGQLVTLVDTLQTQHKAGRRVTAEVLHLTAGTLKAEADRRRLRTLLASFVRMYEPHEAREDTVLFPAFSRLLSPRAYAALGDQFEEEEHKHFGEDGFEHMVDRVAGLEKALGLYDLAQFTPRG